MDISVSTTEGQRLKCEYPYVKQEAIALSDCRLLDDPDPHCGIHRDLGAGDAYLRAICPGFADA